MTGIALLLLSGLACAAASEGGHPVVGGLVRSREWVIRRAPEREEEFIGDVSYRKGPDFFQADWALFNHKTERWLARGRVRLEHLFASGDRLEVQGERAEYDQVSERGRLLPAPGARVSFVRRPAAGEPDYGSAGSVAWHDSQQVRFEDGVSVWGPRLELQGSRGSYDAASGELVVSGGRPVLRAFESGWTGAVQADVVAARRDPEELRAEGRTRGWIRFKDELEKLAR
ncbi:MAG: hypothetical protein PHF00_08775 [Elusimicrobia bacterium]|nr:hypothetical protein [Elusimicrobiota bacterium]